MRSKARGAEKVELDDLFKRSDFVSINCPLTPETRKLMGAREFALMKPDAYFITTARGSIHDEEALERGAARQENRRRRARRVGKGAAAGQSSADEIRQRDGDAAYGGRDASEARTRMGQIAAEQMLDALDGKPVPRIINPQVWPDYAKRFEKTFGFAPEASAGRTELARVGEARVISSSSEGANSESSG